MSQKEKINNFQQGESNSLLRRAVGAMLFFLLAVTLFACSSGSGASPTQPVSNTSAAVLQVSTPTPVPTSAEFVDTPVVVAETAVPVPTAVPTEIINRVFDAFVEKVKNGRSDQIVGVYIENVLALPVIQQPMDASGMPINAGFVSTDDDVATQFLYAYIYADGNIGLLAHNYLAGRYFFNIEEGDMVELIYGDGRVEEYAVNQIEQFQALSPRSPTSNFLNLVTGETLTSTELFYQVYGGDKRVTFQTCINRDNDSEWGRLFPIAFPSD